ncbi:hypothetical protein [Methylorubrum extorquens]|uniref:Scaffolding protein n=1 Tax=Methylorubrum extorquens TaxID=408 RepID=A0AAX3WPA4_METEX|nr:hypothetical protein [Methylorubrum extorquens]WHQ72530.1 hypothetical protein KEC54_13740 [Methylorubrum extorquens]
MDQRHMDEDLIVLGAQAETPAAGSEASDATPPTIEGQPAEIETGAATPGEEGGEPSAEPKPEPAKVEGEGEGGEERPKKRSGIQRMQDRIARLEDELASARSAAPAAGEDRAAAIEKEIGPAPKEEDFSDWAEFDRAQRRYDVKLAVAEQRIADREAASASRQAEEKASVREAAIEAFQERLDETRGKIPDFDAALSAAKDREVKPHVTELVIESEKGGLLAYYLAKNPDVLTKLNGMSEREAAKTVGKLEARLTLAKPKTATAAPSPAKPVTGAAAPGPDPSKMSFAEYEKWRSKPRG